MEGWLLAGDWRPCSVDLESDSLVVKVSDLSTRRQRRMGIDQSIKLSHLFGLHRESVDTLSVHFVQDRRRRALKIKGVSLPTTLISIRPCSWLIVHPVKCKAAQKIVNQTLLPMLSLAGCSSVMVKATEYATHAYLIGHDTRLEDYDGCLVVGEGLLPDWVNGFIARWGPQTGLPLGLVPLNKQAAVMACLSALHGHTKPLDLVRVEQGRRVLYAMAGIEWGRMIIPQQQGKLQRLLKWLQWKLKHTRQLECRLVFEGGGLSLHLLHLTRLKISVENGRLLVAWTELGGEPQSSTCTELSLELIKQNVHLLVDGRELLGESIKVNILPAAISVFESLS